MKKKFTSIIPALLPLSWQCWALLIIVFLSKRHTQASDFKAGALEFTKGNYTSDVSKAMPAGEQVTSFTLINSATKASILTLTNGSTLNLLTLPTKNINIRANTSPATVGSVVFALSGAQSRNHTETLAPYDLFGDNLNWTPAVGNYTLTATPYSAAKGGGTAGTAKTIIFTVVNPQTMLVNFQDPATVPSSGWVRDYGQPYGLRTGSYQGNSKLTYGWKNRADHNSLNLAVGGTTPGNGRNRGLPATSLPQATLVHMQASDIAGTFNGTKAEGYWEAKVPNGFYDVTVSAGDAGVFPFPERHSLNVEGVQAITQFVPTGVAGAATRFQSATVRVTVTDGNLTLDADGGFNTKINSARVVPVASGPYTYWSANEQVVSIEKGSSGSNKTFSFELSNSSNKSTTQYTVSAVYGAGGSGWLSFNPTHTGAEPNVTFNYAAAQALPVGTYQATVKAAAAGFSSGAVVIRVKVSAPHPYVVSSTPANGTVNVSVNTASIAANNLFVPEVEGYKGGVDNSTITSSTVKLLKVTGTTTSQVPGVVQGTGGGDAISFSPTFALEANTTYRFEVTSGVHSYSAASFLPYKATFTTGAALEPSDPLAVEFTKVPIPGTQGKKYSSLTIGPDGKMYALLLSGDIERYAINRTNGTLTFQQLIKTLTTKYGTRSAVGLVFDPAATATNLIAYLSHCSNGLTDAPEFDGNISRLTGTDLGTERLLVTKLPRSTKDHLVNSLAFGPDGALYISQGSNSSMGAYDGSWQRTESLLAGAVLRLDLSKLGSAPLNVQTTANQSVINAASTTSPVMSDGTYNPYAINAPLKIYASGIRNAYDLVWHSNGQLYAPANGSAAGGNTPATVTGTRRLDGSRYNGPAVSATFGVQVQNDWLFRINPNKEVGYFGHPNPLRGEYVANRGHADNAKYPSTVVADLNYRGAAFNFELNRSPNGAIEYKSDAFNGALKGKLLVCRFSGGGDIIVLQPGALRVGESESNYDIKDAYTGAGTSGLVGMSGFINPLDLVEDRPTGNLYVIEFNWNNTPGRTSQITLLRVSDISDDEGYAAAFPESISATEVVGVTNSTSHVAVMAAKNKNKEKDKDKDKDETEVPDLSSVTLHAVTISNTGRGNLKLKSLAITGKNAGEFKMVGQPDAKPNKPVRIRKNSSVTFNVAFYPTSKGEKNARLEAASSKKRQDQVLAVELHGLGLIYEEENAANVSTDSTEKAVLKVRAKTTRKEPVLTVYPNPGAAGSKIYVDLASFAPQESITLTLYDTFGQLYQAKTVVTDAQGGSSAEMPVTPAMKSGMYILKAKASSGQKQTKIILE